MPDAAEPASPPADDAPGDSTAGAPEEPTLPDDPATRADSNVEVTVVRSGGFAGLTREWSVAPGPDQRAAWIELVDRCPWEQEPDEPEGADRYMWTVVATLDLRPRTAELSEHQVRGAWRDLIDAVRTAASPGDDRPSAPTPEA